jgi:hypothetical protein
VPPPFGTASPKATTRGLDETPYLGSTRLANLSDEAQLARMRHVATAAALRAARTIDFDRRIPIRPNYHSTSDLPTLRLVRLTSRSGPPPHRRTKISQPERGGNGVSFGVAHLTSDVVNQS